MMIHEARPSKHPKLSVKLNTEKTKKKQEKQLRKPENITGTAFPDKPEENIFLPIFLDFRGNFI